MRYVGVDSPIKNHVMIAQMIPQISYELCDD